jgi:Fur family ferric uptake transcriptional regulator
MTISPDAPRLRFDGFHEAVDALRARGLRLSTARRLMLEALFTAEGPISAVHLARALSIDESSVYRNLEVLEGHGVVRHVHLGHGPGLYVLLGSDEAEYLYCNHCAKVTVVAPEQLDDARAEIFRAVGYEAHFTHFAIVGLCETCAAVSDEAADRGHEPSPAGLPRDAHSHGDFVHSHSRAGAETHAHRH